jgi:dienelactone hydrolase
VFFPCGAAAAAANNECAAVVANPVNGSAGRWPAVVFGVGWMSWALRYERTLMHLASHGFVVLAPTTVDHQAVPHAWEYAQTLLAALQFAAAESARPGSLLAGRVDVDRSALFGHSMGAGSALVAAALSADSSYAASLGNNIAAHPDWLWGAASLLDFDASRAAWPHVRAYVGLGTFPPTAPLTGFAPLRARTLFIMPEGDLFVPPEAQKALWNALPAAAPRTLALLHGASHCWLDEPAPGAGWSYPLSQCDMAEENGATYMPPRAQVRRRTRRRLVATMRALLRRPCHLSDASSVPPASCMSPANSWPPSSPRRCRTAPRTSRQRRS